MEGSSSWAKDNSSSSSWVKVEETNSWGQGWNTKGSPWVLTVKTEHDQDDRSTGGNISSRGTKMPNTSSAWGTPSNLGKVSFSSPAGEKNDLWSSSMKKESTDWGSEIFDNDDSSQHVQGWGRDRGGLDWDWGRGRGRESFRGRRDGDWNNNRSPMPVYDPNTSSILTVTGHRLDMFPAELQDVLIETDAIMKNLKRIMSLKEYSDGEPLREEDQKYIIENVFNYHPDKAVKTGAGLDHIMVTKHKEFPYSRCLHAVSVDGYMEDFSFLKGLVNFVKEKYPEKAQEFVPMYFRRRQPHGGRNNEQGPGTPRMSSPAGWNKEQEPGTKRKGSPWGAKSCGLTVKSLKTEHDQDDMSTGGNISSWGTKMPNISSAWGAPSNLGKVSSLSPTGKKKDLWSSSMKKESTDWGSEDFDNDGSSQHVQGWGRDRGGMDWDWGRGRGRETSSILMRLHMFSAELYDVLMETEAIMKNTWRILHLKGYSDGEPLPEEDQKYIIENVFNYHPEKAIKTGAGLDHIMIDKHKEHLESRCFYAVSVDGNKEAFSYFKCLEMFVKEKYPEKAEEFIPIYFRIRRQP